jgi:hypothetical protein
MNTLAPFLPRARGRGTASAVEGADTRTDLAALASYASTTSKTPIRSSVSFSASHARSSSA